jgi:hypothetical protein
METFGRKRGFEDNARSQFTMVQRHCMAIRRLYALHTAIAPLTNNVACYVNCKQENAI